MTYSRRLRTSESQTPRGTFLATAFAHSFSYVLSYFQWIHSDRHPAMSRALCLGLRTMLLALTTTILVVMKIPWSCANHWLLHLRCTCSLASLTHWLLHRIPWKLMDLTRYDLTSVLLLCETTGQHLPTWANMSHCAPKSVVCHAVESRNRFSIGVPLPTGLKQCCMQWCAMRSSFLLSGCHHSVWIR